MEAWTRGATELTSTNANARSFDDGARAKFTMGSPVFRYINANIRRANDTARTLDGRSARQLLKDGGHRAMKNMHSRPPAIWW